MYICGIIAEYDPFHTGHQHQFSAIRKILGDDCAIVCVMSGNWTQRGSPAIVDKFLRARLALMGGADLVLELPLPYAISSAEWFARGGVSTLQSSGIITHLCFGSECGDLIPLSQSAQCLDSVEYTSALRGYLDLGLSFPVARQKAVEQLVGSVAECLNFPNNNLGVEYLRALKWCNSKIEPITVQRQGAGHGEAAREGFSSASHLRDLLRSRKINDAKKYFIDCEADLLYSSSFSDCINAERSILYRLRQMNIDDFELLPDCGEGLSHRLYKAVRENSSIDEILTAAKSKRYTLARLRRILLWAFLGLTAEDRPDTPPYIRVLGMNQTGAALLREMNRNASTPILTKPAHVRQLSKAANDLFELEVRATDLYALTLPQVSSCGKEWIQSPVIFDVKS